MFILRVEGAEIDDLLLSNLKNRSIFQVKCMKKHKNPLITLHLQWSFHTQTTVNNTIMTFSASPKIDGLLLVILKNFVNIGAKCLEKVKNK